MVEPQWAKLVLLGVAPDEVSCGRLGLAAAPLVQGVEGDDRDERLPSGQLIFLDRSARRHDLAPEAHTLHRRNDIERGALAMRVLEEGCEVSVLSRAGVEQAGLRENGPRRGRAGIEQLKFKFDGDLIIVDLTTQRMEGELECRPQA